MDLYFALTYYHIFCTVLHKLCCNSHDSILLISTATIDSEKISRSIKTTGIFKNVYVLKHVEPKINNRKIAEPQYLDEYINEYIELFLSNFSLNLSDFNNFYICADHFPIGIYLNWVGIKYNYFEDGCGQMSRVKETLSGMNPMQYAIVEKLQLFGRNSNVIKRFINFDNQRQEYDFTARDEDFSANRLISGLSHKDQKRLLDVFEIPQFSLDVSPSESILFCPQHNVNLKLFTTEQQLHQTGLLIDYFAKDLSVYIKPHPNDMFTDYKELGKKVNILPRTFPSELLPVYMKEKFKKGITAWSTSIHSLGAVLERTVCFTSDIDRDFYALHKYYAACRMLSSIVKNNITLYTFGVNNEIVRNMLQESDLTIQGDIHMEAVLLDNEEPGRYDFTSRPFGVLVDNISAPGAVCVNEIRNAIMNSKAEFIIFINSKVDYIFFDGINYEIFGNMVRWMIQKDLLFGAEIFSEINDDEEDIWLYAEDDEMREVISKLSYVKKLPCSKMITRINEAGEGYSIPDTDVLYRNTKMLEGILAATERRVLAELEHNRTMSEKLDSANKALKELSEKLENYEGVKSQLETLKEEEEELKEELDLLNQQKINEELRNRIAELKKQSAISREGE